MRIEIWKDGKVVSSSKNLRGLRAYVTGMRAELQGRAVEKIRIRFRNIEEGGVIPHFTGGLLDVIYTDGATANDIEFNSYSVMKSWIKNWKNSHGARLFVYNTERDLVGIDNPALN